MKKITCLIIAFLFLLLNNLNAQSAYRNFNWGMTIEQVGTLCPDLREVVKTSTYNSEFWRNDFFVVGSFLNCLIGDNLYSPFTPGASGVDYISRENGIYFYFEREQLRCVKIINLNTIHLNDLTNRYGTPHIRRDYFGDQYLFTGENNRFVLFVNDREYSNRLYFLDRQWFVSEYTTFMIKMREQHQRNIQSILD